MKAFARVSHNHLRSSEHPVDEPPLFLVKSLPTYEQLLEASEHHLIDENGASVKFGTLFMNQMTIVCFIRHFWCPLCQDYMTSIKTHVDPELLKQHKVSFIIISNGSAKMIRSYRRIFRTPFPVYTDPSLKLYQAMGMTLKTNDGGPDYDKGEYVKHGLASGIAMVVGRAAKARVPVWEKGGDITQLGGEFVLGPGLNASFAHRMTTTRSHSPIVDVLKAAGVQPTNPKQQFVAPLPPPSPGFVHDQLWLASRMAGVSVPNEAEYDIDDAASEDLCYGPLTRHPYSNSAISYSSMSRGSSESSRCSMSPRSYHSPLAQSIANDLDFQWSTQEAILSSSSLRSIEVTRPSQKAYEVPPIARPQADEHGRQTSIPDTPTDFQLKFVCGQWLDVDAADRASVAASDVFSIGSEYMVSNPNVRDSTASQFPEAQIQDDIDYYHSTMAEFAS